MSQRNLLRFKNLQERGIAKSRAQLKEMVEKYGFPAGFMVGPNSRAYAWLEALPSALEARPPLRGAVRARTEAAEGRKVSAEKDRPDDGNPKDREAA